MTWAEPKTWEGEIPLPTYPWKDDINPKFFALEYSIIYPYTMQDILSTKKENKTYRAIFLENEYLKVTCLPELAGRIYSVLDKTTGEEMFHTNRVVKPGLISMRGAWISGGIEWNTGPHGHSVTIVSPVNATTKKNEDRSVTLIVSNTEKIFRTKWTVHLTLRPGKAFLEEWIRIENPTYMVHPYYFWNCTAFYCLPGTKFIYPMTLGTGHNGTNFFSWPIYEDKDLRWLKNYDRPTSVFAYDCGFDFFGAYDVDLDRGIVQYADHRQLIGKKAWTWGQSDDGLVSQSNLHEGDEQYIEVQSGPLLTQADYGLLKPHQKVEWEEYWYPVHGLGTGYEFANRDIAVQRLAANGKSEFRILATGKFPNARIQIQHENGTIVNNTVHLNPEQPAVVKANVDQKSTVDISVLDEYNQLLIEYTSPLPIPEQAPPESNWQLTKVEFEFTTEEMYLRALTFDQQTNRLAAREWYQKALMSDPKHTESIKGLAVLDIEAGLYDNAIQQLKKGIIRNPDDGELWMYLAVAYLYEDNLEQAMIGATKAIRDENTTQVGYDLVGTILMRRGEYGKALHAFQKSVLYNPGDTRANDHLLLALYANDQHDRARKLAVSQTESQPTNPVPFAILALENKKEWDTVQDTLLHNLGEKEFELIEAGLVFANLGLYKEAYQTLKALLIDTNPISIQNPMVYYYLAEWAAQMGDQSQAVHWTQFASSDFVKEEFPSRLKAVDALSNALPRSRAHGITTANTYLRLGNLYGGLGRLDEAETHWSLAVQINSDLNIAHRNLGLYAWKHDRDLEKAIEHYKSAIQAEPEDQTLYRDAAAILIQDSKRKEAITLLESQLQNGIRMDAVETLGRAYVDEKQYTKAIDLLSGSFFSNWENRTVSRRVFVEAHMERGKQYFEDGNTQSAYEDFATALTYPKHLGVGRPANPAEAEPLYWKGRALQKLGKQQEAKEAWCLGAESHPRKFREMCKEALK